MSTRRVSYCRLSLNLKKCHLFSPRFKFVRHDIAEDGNHPAQSKFDLVRNWPQPRIVCDVASLLGFCMFYSCFIPWLEVKCKDLRLLCQQDYNTIINPSSWTPYCQSQWDFMKQSISCLTHVAHNMIITKDFASRQTLLRLVWGTLVVNLTMTIFLLP